MPFVKGQSGNPAGRQKEDATVKEMARAHTADAMEVLVQCLSAKNDSTRIAAAQAILDRGWGKPAQDTKTEHSGSIGLAELIESVHRDRSGG